MQYANDGRIYAQSRNGIITPKDDLFGFAAWIGENIDWFRLQFKYIDKSVRPITIFGEWCGKGIQKNTAINKIDRKIFAIFAIQFEDSIMVEPKAIDAHLNKDLAVWESSLQPDNLYILPWFEERLPLFTSLLGVSNLNIMYNNDCSIKEAVDYLNDCVTKIEKCDPWVKKVFDIEGIGEGLVWYPCLEKSLWDVDFEKTSQDMSKSFVQYDSWSKDVFGCISKIGKGTVLESYVKDGFIESGEFSKYVFKVKGKAHKVNTSKTAVQLDPDVLKNINEFVDKFATENRFMQGVCEINNGNPIFEQKLIGKFIGWVSKDIKKESAAELEVSGLIWQQINNKITQRSREWYIKKLEEV